MARQAHTKGSGHTKGLLFWQHAVIGSVFFGQKANDIDILLAVPDEELQEAQALLCFLGFTRNTCTLQVPCRYVTASYSRAPIDILLIKPENFNRKMAILESVRSLGLNVGLGKEQRYALFEELAAMENLHLAS